VHTKDTLLDENVNLKTIAKVTPGMSGADLANLINESALIASKEKNKKITMDNLEKAQEKILFGSERKNITMDYHEYHKTAYHESGHAIVTTLLPNVDDPVHKVSIIPRDER
jgi:cell division protease FtsH